MDVENVLLGHRNNASLGGGNSLSLNYLIIRTYNLV